MGCEGSRWARVRATPHFSPVIEERTVHKLGDF